MSLPSHPVDYEIVGTFAEGRAGFVLTVDRSLTIEDPPFVDGVVLTTGLVQAVAREGGAKPARLKKIAATTRTVCFRPCVISDRCRPDASDEIGIHSVIRLTDGMRARPSARINPGHVDLGCIDAAATGIAGTITVAISGESTLLDRRLRSWRITGWRCSRW